MGIVIADTIAGLRSVLDLDPSSVPELVRYVDGAVMWRVVVVGDKAVGVTRGVIPEGDFRSVASDEPGDYATTVPAALAKIAIAATRAVEVRAAGVDLLQKGDEIVVLEVNTPFYFGHLQSRGIDVAGALVEMLVEA